MRKRRTWAGTGNRARSTLPARAARQTQEPRTEAVEQGCAAAVVQRSNRSLAARAAEHAERWRRRGCSRRRPPPQSERAARGHGAACHDARSSRLPRRQQATGVDAPAQMGFAMLAPAAVAEPVNAVQVKVRAVASVQAEGVGAGLAPRELGGRLAGSVARPPGVRPALARHQRGECAAPWW
jgi:hypothetical protein